MKKHIFTFLALFLCASIAWADVDSSTDLKTYYASANTTSGNQLRLALQNIIDGHTVVSYGDLGTIMQYSDTEGADGRHVVDIYTDCNFTCSGPITWKSSGDVGAGMNREHTVPQSWFDKKSPMVSDAFHIYPTDCKANNNRSSYLYGEFSGAGTSYSTSKCRETGKLSTGTSNTIASYSYKGQTYAPTATHSGKVYEPDDEYKGDLARSYFYMATRYADVCANWSGGAFLLCLKELIKERGTDYLCGENGQGLSGGEKQRISIARSLLKESSILIADEATSALDAKTSYEVINEILELDSMTRIVVTHSLEEALLRHYDEIIVIKDGTIEEKGSFDQLIDNNGYFKALYTIVQ